MNSQIVDVNGFIISYGIPGRSQVLVYHYPRDNIPEITTDGIKFAKHYSIINWTQCLDNKYPVDVVYLDFHKAFDMVPRKYLLMVMVSRAACYLGLKLFNWKEAVSCLKWSLV